MISDLLSKNSHNNKGPYQCMTWMPGHSQSNNPAAGTLAPVLGHSPLERRSYRIPLKKQRGRGIHTWCESSTRVVECLTWFVKLHMRIGSLDIICSWIAMKKSLHKLHKVRNALVEMHNLLLLLCNVGFSPLHAWNECIKGSIFPCGAFVLRLSKPVGPDILRSFVSK